MYLLSRYAVSIIGNLCTYLYLHPSLSISSPRIHFYLYYPTYLLHTIHYYPMIQLAPIWSDSYHFVPFHSVPFRSVLFCSVLSRFVSFYIPLRPIPFYSILFYAVLFYFVFLCSVAFSSNFSHFILISFVFKVTL